MSRIGMQLQMAGNLHGNSTNYSSCRMNNNNENFSGTNIGNSPR